MVAECVCRGLRMLRRALGPRHVIFSYSTRVIKTSALVLVHFKLVLGFSLFLFVVLSSMLSGELYCFHCCRPRFPGWVCQLTALRLLSSFVTSTGLFQRAVLMSGSALSPWAIARDAGKYSRRIGQALDCPVDDSRALVDCLKTK